MAIFKTRNGEWRMGTGNENGEWEWNGNGSGNGNHKKTSFKKTNKFFVCLHGEKKFILCRPHGSKALCIYKVQITKNEKAAELYIQQIYIVHTFYYV
jgi:hypothetical protein